MTTTVHLQPMCDQYFQLMNEAWQFCRSSSIKKVELESNHCQCWNAFFTTLVSTVPAICFIEYAAKLANKFGVKNTIVMADQTLHDTSNGLRDQASHDDDIGILLSYVCSTISLKMLWAQLEKLRGTIMLKRSL